MQVCASCVPHLIVVCVDEVGDCLYSLISFVDVLNIGVEEDGEAAGDETISS